MPSGTFLSRTHLRHIDLVVGVAMDRVTTTEVTQFTVV